MACGARNGDNEVEPSYMAPIGYPYRFLLRMGTSEVNFVFILQGEVFYMGFTVY